MTATTEPVIRAKSRGFVHDIESVAIRALKLIPRDIEGVIPPLIIPIFFYVVNVGSLQNIADAAAGGNFDYKAFQLPVAIIFAVTGVSRASNLVMDIQDGYFDRMLMTPLHRRAILLGLMVSDFVLVFCLCIPVIILGYVTGVTFTTGILGILAFLLISALWGVAFTGFPYAVALKTGSPAAVNSSFLLFFPFAFLTTSFVPQDQMTGWLATIATYNPMTYLLEGLRALIMTGWDWAPIGKALAAILGVGLVSQWLAFAGLRGRVSRGG